MIDLQIDSPYQDGNYDLLLKKAAAETLKHLGQAGNTNLTIVLTDDEHLQKLNLEYLGIDAPTDVLSFPTENASSQEAEGYLGDILISQPRAAAQAKAGGHSMEQELELLAVHGVLHLLGHEHAGESDKEHMWAAQREILHSLDNPLNP
jgi:probable rRNA maturation factor